jgi:hypothetical protein
MTTPPRVVVRVTRGTPVNTSPKCCKMSLGVGELKHLSRFLARAGTLGAIRPGKIRPVCARGAIQPHLLPTGRRQTLFLTITVFS